METRNTLVTSLDVFRIKVVHIMANVSWRAEPEAEILLIGILGYSVLLLLLIKIHRRVMKRHKRIHENLVNSYDTLRYQVAKIQYANPAIQNSKWVKVVIEADQKNYLVNAKAIKEEILSIEQTLGQPIVSTDQWNAISRQTKRKHAAKIFVEIIGRLTTLLTVGIYKLFW